MQRQFDFRFTAEEVNARTFVDQGVLRFVKNKEKPAIPGKEPYTKLLCTKVSELVPVPSIFTVEEPLRKATENVMRCYVKCSHKINNPVLYKESDLKENHELPLSVFFKCFHCLNVETVQTSSTSAQATPSTSSSASPASSSLPFTAVGIQRDIVLSPLFDRASVGVNREFNKAFNECLTVPDPKAYFYNNREKFADLIKQAFLDETAGVANDTLIENIPLPIVDPNLPSTSALLNASQTVPLPDFMNLSTQAQKRAAEAKKAATLAKKRKTTE